MPVDQGNADRVSREMTRIAILDYGMGNLRSVEKALEHVGAEAVITADPETRPRRRRRDPARRRRLPARRCAACASWASTRWSPSASSTARRCSASASASSCSSRPRSRTSGAQGLGLLAGEVEPLQAPGLKVPHIGWSPVRWERESRADRGPRAGDAVLLRPHLHAAPPRRRRRARHRRVRRALRLRRRARRRSTASSSTPRSRAPRACACCRTSRRSAPRVVSAA